MVLEVLSLIRRDLNYCNIIRGSDQCSRFVLFFLFFKNESASIRVPMSFQK